MAVAKSPAMKPEPFVKVALIKKGTALMGEVDSIIVVDRLVKPAYPDWVKEVLHLELEMSGPNEFDMAQLEQLLVPGQIESGKSIYDHLEANKMLDGCLGLRDLEEIKKKGVRCIYKHFKRNRIVGWRSVVLNRASELDRQEQHCVPFLALINSCSEVVLRWERLDNPHVHWNAILAPRFA